MNIMKTKIKIKGLDLRGKTVHIIKTIDCPDFVDKPISLKPLGIDYDSVQTVDDQIISWFDKQDKTYIMYDPAHELTAIIDYWIYKPTKRVSFKRYVATQLDGHSPKLIADVAATYISMKDSLKGFSHAKKLKLVLAAVDVGYLSAIQVHKRTIKLLSGDGDVTPPELDTPVIFVDDK